jgi:hypothetical protein
MRFRDPLQRRSMLAQPSAVSCSCRRVGDRVRDLGGFADGGDRKPATEEVGN